MSRARTQQPQYDFLTGGGGGGAYQGDDASAAMPLRNNSLRASTAVRPEQGNEELRAQLLKLQYDLDSLKQERQLADVRHQEELRAVQAKADEDYKRAQASETSTSAASSRYEQLAQDLRSAQETATQDKASLERKLKASHDQVSSLQEEVDEAKNERAELERQFKRDMSELQSRCDSLARSDEEARVEHERQSKALELAQQRLSQKEEEVGALENQIMQLKTHTGDADSLGVIKRELSEQVAHIQKLETANSELQIELKQLRKSAKGIQVVEEEKKHLESKLSRMNDLRKELSETQLQKQILQDERREWATYLEDAGEGDTEVKFDSPQELAKAFVQERLERATLTDKLGQITPELTAKDSQIEALENDKAALASELETARAEGDASNTDATGTDSKAITRLERQRALTTKEVDYLRAQMKTFDTEASELQGDKFDAAKSERITELEGLLDQHRKELSSVHDSLKALEANASQSSAPRPSSPLKRPRDASGDGGSSAVSSERIGSLTRKNRSLQDDLSATTRACKLLQKDLKVAQSQLAALKSSSRVRVLECKDNPAAAHARIKQSALDTLRAENESLLAQLEGRDAASAAAQVPRSSLHRLRHDLDAKDRELATAAKHDARLKTIFQGKAMEFNDSVASILGWRLEFMPNGRVKVSSRYYAADADEECFILFDGDEGTMKISGGARSRFAAGMRDEVEHWVEGIKEIPCFLAALTLKFHERLAAGGNTAVAGK